MTHGAAERGDADLDEIAAALQHELAGLVEAAEKVLAELEGINALRAKARDPAIRMRQARDTRRDAVRMRSEAVELVAHAREVAARSRALEGTFAARMACARELLRRQ